MNIVRSQEKNDCGICALACATGKAWHVVKAAIWSGRAQRKFDKQRRLGVPSNVEPSHDNATSGADLITAGYRLGVTALTKCKGTVFSPTRRTTWSDMATMLKESGGQWMIVKVQYADVPRSHWVVFDGEVIFDSNFDHRERLQVYPHEPLAYIIFTDLL